MLAAGYTPRNLALANQRLARSKAVKRSQKGEASVESLDGGTVESVGVVGLTIRPINGISTESGKIQAIQGESSRPTESVS